MATPNIRLDILTENEDLFQSQISTILKEAIEGFRTYTDVEIHFINIESAYYSLDIRIEKVYGNEPLERHPDYSRFLLDLSLWRSLLQSQLMSEDYRSIISLSNEAKRIASGF